MNTRLHLIGRHSNVGFFGPALKRGNGRKAPFKHLKKTPVKKSRIKNRVILSKMNERPAIRDSLLQEVETTFDGNSNAILVTARDRFHDETGTGALGTASTGVKARVSYAASYFLFSSTC